MVDKPKKINYYDQDDQLFQELQRDKELTKEYDLLNLKFPNKTNGEIPKSRFDQGRNCPNCGGRLFHKGPLASDSDQLLLRCARCRREFFAQDVDNQLEITDKLYRTIPQTVQNKWNEHRRKYRNRD